MNNMLSKLLKDVMGLNVTSISKRTLHNALSRRMRATDIENEALYLQKLKSSPQEISKLIDEVVINETWFFRDEAPFTVLKTFAQDRLRKGMTSPMRLLSIPCATGEEPYSMAITLLEAGLPEKLFSINAIDISRKSIEFAEKGVYGDRSFRRVDNSLKRLYFKELKKGFSLNNNIKKAVRFSRGNLLNLSLPLAFWGYDVIFCRNLLIYLDPASQKQAISTLHRLLTDDGLLFVGHAEPGLFTGSLFSPALHPKSFMFVKRKNTDPTGDVDLPTPPPNEVTVTAAGADRVHSDTLAANQLLQAQILAGQGKHDQAIKVCEHLIKINKPEPRVFMLLGMIFDEKQDQRNAVKMLKKAIYLDPNYLDAMELLCNLYKRQADDSNHHATLRRIGKVRERLHNASPEGEEVS